MKLTYRRCFSVLLGTLAISIFLPSCQRAAVSADETVATPAATEASSEKIVKTEKTDVTVKSGYQIATIPQGSRRISLCVSI